MEVDGELAAIVFFFYGSLENIAGHQHALHHQGVAV
jgi:hypothetical protein